MDRLPHLICALPWVSGLLLPGCGGDGTRPPPVVARRVDAVPAAPRAPVDVDAFCEARFDAASAPRFTWPPLATPAPDRSRGWTWVNLWATWCGPCVEELPMILQWPEALAADGAVVDLALVSVDDDDDRVAGFRATHPWLPPTARAEQAATIPDWLSDLGLDLPATLPLHLFVDPAGRLRCARSGAVQRDDRQAIATLVAEG